MQRVLNIDHKVLSIMLKIIQLWNKNYLLEFKWKNSFSIKFEYYINNKLLPVSSLSFVSSGYKKLRLFDVSNFVFICLLQDKSLRFFFYFGILFMMFSSV